MKHRIRVDTVYRYGRGRAWYQARVEREDGTTVHTTQATLTAEECWEDAARYCERHGLEVVAEAPRFKP